MSQLDAVIIKLNINCQEIKTEWAKTNEMAVFFNLSCFVESVTYEIPYFLSYVSLTLFSWNIGVRVPCNEAEPDKIA